MSEENIEDEKIKAVKKFKYYAVLFIILVLLFFALLFYLVEHYGLFLIVHTI